jgi:hypothetical protein
MAANNPLSQDHLKYLNDVLRSIPQARDLANKCKDCGLPVDEFLSQLDEQQTMATKLKSNFFPNES